MSLEILKQKISPKLTDSVFTNIIQNVAKHLKNPKIKILMKEDNSKAGNSYLSSICIFDLIITGVNELNEEQIVTVPLISKGFLKNVARMKTFRSFDFFETEIYFYEKVWPLMEDFKSKKLPNLYSSEVPMCFATFCDGSNDYIILENLTYKGYKSADRSQELTLEEIKLMIKLLARFHSISLAMKEEVPEFEQIASNLKETYFSESLREWYVDFQKYLFRNILHATKLNLPQIYYDKMQKLFNSDFYGLLCRLCKIKSKLSVVTQGDAWIPNFLLKHQNGKPLEAVLIDFQLARYTTLTNDLSFCLYCCVPEKYLFEKWDELIAYYHESLMDHLVQFGMPFNFITLDELNEDLKNHGIFGFGMAIENVNFSLLTEEEVNSFNLDQIQGNDAVPLAKVWTIPQFEDKRNDLLSSLVKHVIDIGFVENYI